MIKYTVNVYDENANGSDLVVVKYFYNADEADAYAREMSMDYDWVRVVPSTEHGSTVYIQGRIVD